MPELGSSTFSETDASNNSASPNGAPEGMNPSGVNDTMRAGWGALKRFWNRHNSVKTTAGTNTAYTLSYDVAVASDYDGEEHSFILNATTGSAPTLAISGRTARNLRKLVAGTWTNVASGDYLANAVLTVRYNLASTAYDIVRVSEEPMVSILSTKGDLLGRTSSAPARVAVGANGTVPMARSAATTGLAYVAALNSAIYGLTYANNSGDATNDIDIAAGGCMDATGAYWITVAALTKQSDVAWAVGSAAGGLDTGAVGNSDYYIWAIARSDTGVTDILFSLSSTAPTMPTNYDYKRLIGWFKRTGGAIIAFAVKEIEGGGIEFTWSTPTLDVSLSNTLTTSRRTDAVRVPLDVSTVAHVRVGAVDVSSSFSAIIGSPDEADVAPSITAAPLATFNAAANTTYLADMWIRTSATGTIAARASLSTVDSYYVVTLGFFWSRR